MAQAVIAAESSILEVMDRWPSTIPLFTSYRMLCIGCTFGRFHSIADACAEHHVEIGPFLSELNRIAAIKRR